MHAYILRGYGAIAPMEMKKMSLYPFVGRPRAARLASAVALALGLAPAFAGAQSLCVDATGIPVRVSTAADAVACGADAAAAGRASAAGNGATEAVSAAQPEAVASSLADASDYFAAAGMGDGSDMTIATGENAVAAGALSAATGIETSAFGFQSVAMGDHASAFGGSSFALGTGSTSVGTSTSALGDFSTALGFQSQALDSAATAIGGGSQANNFGSTALGADSISNGYLGTAVGALSTSTGDYDIAMGVNSVASGGYGSMALGYRATSSANRAIAIGSSSLATGNFAVAIGESSNAAGVSSVAVGGAAHPSLFGAPRLTQAWGQNSAAFGAGAYTDPNAKNAVAIGASTVWSENAIAMGTKAFGQYKGSVALGAGARSIHEGSVALGTGSQTNRLGSVAIGNSVSGLTRQITGVAAGSESTDAVNVGQLDAAIAGVGGDVGQLVAEAVKYDDAGTKDAITLGGGEGTVIGNVKAGTAAMDAVNYGQLSSLAALLGGGNGQFWTPSYVIDGSSFGSVGDAFAAVDGALTRLTSRVSGLEQTPGRPVGTGDGLAIGEGSHAADLGDTAYGNGAVVDADGSTAVGNNSTIDAAATNSVAVGADSNVTAASGTALGQGASATAQGAVALGQGSVADQASTVSVGSAGNERRVVNVAAGTAATDAANVQQMQAGDEAALASANTYTDTTATQTLTRANAYTEGRLQALDDQFSGLRDEIGLRLGKQDERIDRQGAMSSAMMSMAINAANSRSPRGRVAVGAGWQNGESALSVGYSKSVGERASFSVGGAFSDDDQSAGVGLGIDL
ncbi:YadA-like family protein [Lysobacter sp. S4-A87]|uniref:YadA-like family protein n=1 Tax=Lysobacter sp. S4-A87 TaxID=2925843 RepID=UPI001F52DF29|nr:YadA-like family protein [Lysobacter sp. S4-A87]UNK50049.1 YadA-like family protein [Lysobacter sp. S4-A87]